ncbi:hypothetical protein STCU_07619 [Strigomonas culicis]|uniref:RRM domain-containing protein n=1 Tax=Strigomonas culicis TaxID=28005 RepID=S9V9H1_9TRYP|nr:hypothetical protein STCU_07619 [Strigomonas culicis]|eukprot:EPY23621.1 hypothetical protein STCU_07619 [Strigomonas culicis]
MSQNNNKKEYSSSSVCSLFLSLLFFFNEKKKTIYIHIMSRYDRALGRGDDDTERSGKRRRGRSNSRERDRQQQQQASSRRTGAGAFTNVSWDDEAPTNAYPLHNNNNGSYPHTANPTNVNFAADIMKLLQQQQQQSNNPTTATMEGEAAVKPLFVNTNVVPVNEFVPMIPVSLSGLLNLPPQSPPPPPQSPDPSSEGILGGAAPSPPPDAAASANPTNVLALIEAPKISLDAERRAREGRRAHLSGFGSQSNDEEIRAYLQLLLPELRRMRTQREMREAAEALAAYEAALLSAGGGAAAPHTVAEEDLREIPPNTRCDHIDVLINFTGQYQKSKPFGFVEVNYADLITEMVYYYEQSLAAHQAQQNSALNNNHGGSTNPSPYFFECAADRRTYYLAVKRPKDYDVLQGQDDTKCVCLGFPPSLPEGRMRALFEQFGDLAYFEMKDGIAYIEFKDGEEEEDAEGGEKKRRDARLSALECRAEMHGSVLNERLMLVHPLHDWLKVLLHQKGFNVRVEDDDPISGKYVLHHEIHQTDAHPSPAAEAAATAGAGGGPSTALVLAGKEAGAGAAGSEKEVMKEILEMKVPLAEVVLHLATYPPHPHPHLLAAGPHAPLLQARTTTNVFPTRILVLLNCFDEEELVLDAPYRRLVEEMEREVERHGRVTELIIPRRTPRPHAPQMPKRPAHDEEEEDAHDAPVEVLPGGGSGRQARYERQLAEYEEAKIRFQKELHEFNRKQLHPLHGGYGRVFVVYETVEEAAAAQAALVGRLFGRRSVITSFLFEDLYFEADEEADADADMEEEEGQEEVGQDAERGDSEVVEEADDLD